MNASLSFSYFLIEITARWTAWTHPTRTCLPACRTASSRLPAQVYAAPGELTPAAAPTAIDSRQLFRGLVRNWWRILFAWLVLAAPLTYLLYRLIEPTYQAYSMIKIESNQPELFDHGLIAHDGSGSQPSYLQTEVESIRSNPVLELAITSTVEPRIANCPMIKQSLDPKDELRKKLEIQILPNTHWIRVAVDSKDPKEAADIVNAVVTAYHETTKDTGSINTTLSKKNNITKALREDLEAYKKGLQGKIELARTALKELAIKGNVEFEKPTLGTRKDEAEQSPQPAFNTQSLEAYKNTKDHLMQTEFQIMDLEARYAAKQAEEQQALASRDDNPAPEQPRATRKDRPGIQA